MPAHPTLTPTRLTWADWALALALHAAALALGTIVVQRLVQIPEAPADFVRIHLAASPPSPAPAPDSAAGGADFVPESAPPPPAAPAPLARRAAPPALQPAPHPVRPPATAPARAVERPALRPVNTPAVAPTASAPSVAAAEAAVAASPAPAAPTAVATLHPESTAGHGISAGTSADASASPSAGVAAALEPGQHTGSSSGSGAVGPSWLQRLHSLLAKYKTYPPNAQRLRQEGTVVLHIRVDTAGRATASVYQSSGIAALDAAALALFDRAARAATRQGAPEQAVQRNLPIQYALRP